VDKKKIKQHPLVNTQQEGGKGLKKKVMVIGQEEVPTIAVSEAALRTIRGHHLEKL